MGCRCGDIADYNDDIKRIVAAEGYTDELIGYVGEVRSTLEELKNEYNSTVEAEAEFIGEFAKLDEGADANAQGILAQLKGAKMTLEQWLAEAEAEDEAFHASENKPLM